MAITKLVRDKIPEVIRAAGDEPVTRVASDAEMGPLLRAKLAEETAEACSASPADLPGELADVLEVVAALERQAGISPAELEAARAAKAAERGAFSAGIVWSGNRDHEAGE